MKRYGLFYLPPFGNIRGGMNDFVVAFDTQDECIEYIKDNSDFDTRAAVIEDMWTYLGMPSGN